MAKQKNEQIDENLTIIRENAGNDRMIKTESKRAYIDSILSTEEQNDTKRAYESPLENELKDGKCAICGMHTMYFARKLCFKHYNEYLKNK